MNKAKRHISINPDTIKTEDDLIAAFLTPIYTAWLLGEVRRGNLIFPGFDYPHLLNAAQSVKWIGVPITSLDPIKDGKGIMKHHQKPKVLIGGSNAG